MTTITINRATVEQALEALEIGYEVGYEVAKAEADRYYIAMAGFRPESHAKMDAEVQQIAQSITALRAALAEPVQEPVAHRVVAGALFDFMGWLTSRRERLVLSSTDDAAPAADAIKDFAEMRGLSMNDAQVKEWQDNVAAPPQRKPLTDEEIEDIYLAWDVTPGRRIADLVRAIERAHNITDPQIEDRLARHGIPMPGDPK